MKTDSAAIARETRTQRAEKDGPHPELIQRSSERTALPGCFPTGRSNG